MLKIALTGPSGSGKGFVSAIMKTHGIPCLDTDRTVHELYADRSFASLLGARLAADITAADGTVDRKKLGAIVFSDPEKMKLLCAVVYPEVEKKMREFFDECALAGKRAAVIDAPQLFEAGFEGAFDMIVCVTAPREVRLKRVIARDGVSRKSALLRFSNQMPAREYMRRSTVTLHNNGVRDIAADTEAMLKKYGAIDGGNEG